MKKSIIEGQAERVAKAAELLAEKAFVVTAESVLVYSDEPGVAGWTVTAAGCTCPDATVGWAARNLGGMCKHRELVAMIRPSAPVRVLVPA